MADQEPDRYRPRRAFAEPGTEPAAEPAASPPPPAEGDRPGDGPDEDAPKPLFREEADGADAATVRSPDGPAPTSPVEDTGSRRQITFVQRRPRLEDDDEPAALPPRSPGRRPVEAGDLIDDEDEERHHLGRRTRLALLVGGVAAVVAVGLAVLYAVVGVSGTPSGTSTPATSLAPSASAAAPSTDALLGDAALLTPEAARLIDPRRTWTVAATDRAGSPDAPGAACLGSDPLEGAPTPAQKVVRTLTSTGKDAAGALHVATAYGSAEEATQAFAVTSRALGTCAVTGEYLASGRVVSGAGDQATGSLIRAVSGTTTTGHTVLVSRTGRVLDVVDAYQPRDPLNVDNVSRALAGVLTSQCQAAGGACAEQVKVSDGPPPVGGDVPGFLTTGDLPPASKTPAPWVATPVEPPAEDFTGSQCETVTWATLSAAAKSSRVYLLQDTPGFFGLNDIVVTTKDAAAATKLVDKTRQDWTTCKERKLTATVAKPVAVTGVATGGAKVTGYTATVQQKTGDATTRFRVGIASSGSKVAFTFLNPTNGMDLTDAQWAEVAVRAVQRATQTR